MEDVIRSLEEKVARGSGKAALELAESYKWGFFGQVDFQKAEKIYRLCAKSKSRALSSKGYYNLGLLYYHGFIGDPEHPDRDKAYRCFVQSSLVFPNRAALTILADMYRYGQAVEKNDAVALALYTQAAAS